MAGTKPGRRSRFSATGHQRLNNGRRGKTWHVVECVDVQWFDRTHKRTGEQYEVEREIWSCGCQSPAWAHMNLTNKRHCFKTH